MPMVVGIFKGHDAVASLAGALKGDGLSVERLQVVTGDTPSEDLATSGVQFIYSGEAEEVSLNPGGLITSFGGTGVPGLTDSTPRSEPFRGRSIEDHLGDLEIPDARLDDYAESVESGRTVAGYPAPDADAAGKLKELFSQAGAATVDIFE